MKVILFSFCVSFVLVMRCTVTLTGNACGGEENDDELTASSLDEESFAYTRNTVQKDMPGSALALILRRKSKSRLLDDACFLDSVGASRRVLRPCNSPSRLASTWCGPYDCAQRTSPTCLF